MASTDIPGALWLAISLLKYSEATVAAVSDGPSSTVAASGTFEEPAVGDEGTRLEDERRGTGLRGGVGVSPPRSDDVDFFLASPGDEDLRSTLTALGLRLGPLGELCLAGDEATRNWSEALGCDNMAGEDGGGVLAAELSESLFVEWESCALSPFVARSDGCTSPKMRGAGAEEGEEGEAPAITARDGAMLAGWSGASNRRRGTCCSNVAAGAEDSALMMQALR